MSEESIIKFLQSNADYFRTNDFITSALHSIGWAITKGLKFLANACQDLYNISFGLVDITNFDQINSFIDGYEGVLTMIMICTLTILGFMFILGKQKQFTFIYSFLIIAVVFTSSQWLFSTLNQGVKYFKDSVVGSSPTNASETIISENLTDLIYIDKQIGLENMDADTNIVHEDVTAEEIKAIDINEVINYKTEKIATQDGKDILKQKLTYDSGGQYSLTEVSNGWGWNSQDNTDLGNEFYYRYTFNYGIAWLSLAGLIIVYICLAYKAIRIIYELVTSRILMPFMASDMTSTQKVMKVLTGIRDGYIALCFTAITLKTYSFFTSYLNSINTVSGIQLSGLTKAILTLFIAFCVIDGANIMQKLTGVDAGLNGAIGKMAAASHLIKGAGNAVASPFRAISNFKMRSNIKQQRDSLSEMRNGGNSNNNQMDQMNQNATDKSNQTDQMNQNTSDKANQMDQMNQNASDKSNQTDQMNQNTSNKSNYKDGSDTNRSGSNEANMNGSEINGSGANVTNMDGAAMNGSEMRGSENTMDNPSASIISGDDGNSPYNSAEANMKQMDQNINGNAQNRIMDSPDQNSNMRNRDRNSSIGNQDRTDMGGRTGADQRTPSSSSNSRMLNRTNVDQRTSSSSSNSRELNRKNVDQRTPSSSTGGSSGGSSGGSKDRVPNRTNPSAPADTSMSDKTNIKELDKQ